MNFSNQRIVSTVLGGLFFFSGVGGVQGASSMIVTSSGAGIDSLTSLTSDNIDRTLGILSFNSDSNDSPNGFSVTISSLKAGQLVRQVGLGYADAGYTGNVADYTMTMAANGNGTLGATEPILPINNDMAIPVNLDFGVPVTTDTIDREYTLKFTIPGKTALLSGTFGDVITITLSDI